MTDFRSSTLSLPPPYAEVVSQLDNEADQFPAPEWNPAPPPDLGSEDWVPQPPPEVQDHALMADTRERLSGEISELVQRTSSNNEHLFDLLDKIQASKRVIENKTTVINDNFEQWKAKAMDIIEQYFNNQHEAFIAVNDAENRRLSRNMDVVKEAISTSRRLQKTSALMTRTGNVHDLQNLKTELNRFSKKLRKMDASALSFTTAESWKVVETSLLHDPLLQKTVMRGFGCIQAEEASVIETSTTSGSVSESPEETDGAAALTTQVSTNEEEVELDEEGDNLEYIMMHSFNTKTYKDKARSHPMSFVVTPDQRIVVPDRYNKKIKLFTLRGQLVKEIVHPILKGPMCVCLTPEGNIAVSDAETGQVSVFTDEGDLVTRYQNLARPIGIAFNHQHHLLAADVSNSAVNVYRESDKGPSLSIKFYNAPVVNPQTGQPEQRRFNFFMRPQYVAVNGTGQRFVVSDHAANCIQVHEQTGRFLSRIGSKGPLLGQFNEPYGVTYSNSGQILVADYGNNRVQSLHPLSGQAQILLGPETGLKYPTCIQQLSDNRILVSEYLSGSIKVFGTAENAAEVEEVGLPPSYSDVFGDASQQSRPRGELEECTRHPARHSTARALEVESFL